MDGCQRFKAALSGREPDRVPYQDTFWLSTIERWRGEGLPADRTPDEYFGCEMARLSADYTLRLPVLEVEHSERYRIYIDANGATRREIAYGDDWTPQWLDFSIKGPDDWEGLRAWGHYDPQRIADGIEDAYRRGREQGRFVVFQVHGCFHPTWQKISMERLLTALLEEPGWIDDMFAVHTQLITDLYDGCKERGVEFDGAWISDDLGYNMAPMISPRLYRERVQPHHARACAHFAADGLPTILHSDGNVGPLIPDFIDAGFRALHPLEAKAGLDVRELKGKYGDRLALFGNIDVRALAGGRAAIEAEITSKVAAAKEGGGYIFHSDHSVPSDVSFDDYRYALEVLERCGSYE